MKIVKPEQLRYLTRLIEQNDRTDYSGYDDPEGVRAADRLYEDKVKAWVFAGTPIWTDR